MHCIGLMSGTSVDGIDACLVEITGSGFNLKVDLLNGATYPYPEELREEIIEVAGGAVVSLPELAHLDDAIAAQFALAAETVQKGMPPSRLNWISRPDGVSSPARFFKIDGTRLQLATGKG